MTALPQVEAQAAGVAATLAEAASHAVDGLPNLLTLARGGPRFERQLRPYLNEAIHCLASALEAALLASRDAVEAGLDGARKQGEPTLLIGVRGFLEQGRP